MTKTATTIKPTQVEVTAQPKKVQATAKPTRKSKTLRSATRKPQVTEPSPIQHRPIRDIRLVSSETPWGQAQKAEGIAPGITKYTTASHGGYFLSKKANAKVPPELQWSTLKMQGLKGWYEEDCDWAIVVYTFQQHFQPELYQQALKSLTQHHAHALEILNSKTHIPPITK